MLAVAAGAHLGASSPLAAQKPETAARDWTSWLDAVNTHVAGEHDDAVTRVAPWSLGQLDALLSEVARQPDQGVRVVERALILHMDIAIVYRRTDGYDLPAGPGDVTLLNDGRAVGQMSRTVHWEFARRLLERLANRAERLRIGRPFYRATGALLQAWAEYPELTAHLAAGQRLLGGDAVLFLYEGTMQQAYAGPRMQRFFDDRRRAEARERPSVNTRLPPAADAAARGRVTLPGALPSARAARSQAARLFRRALAIDPALAEARVRLAHVLGDDGGHDAAAAELERAMAKPLPPVLDYYAALLTGREARARGRLDAARVAFERAAELYPTAQAPHLGLSELAIARNDPDAALARLQARAGAARSDAADPWWWMDRVHVPAAHSLVADLRQMAPR